MRLYEDEGLYARLGGAYTLAALAYGIAGDEGGAKHYAELAASAVARETGDGAADVGAMRELAADPKKHWSWRKGLNAGSASQLRGG